MTELECKGEPHNDGQVKHQRIENDAYNTPQVCVELLLPFIDFRGEPLFVEPCRGDGNIYDLAPCKYKQYCEIEEGKDYFDEDFRGVNLIITNPPFNQALEFLEKSLNEADTVIYLLRLNFFASQKRKEFWQNNKPTHVFVLSDRPSFTGNGTDRTDYMWCAWDRGNRIKTKEPFNWI